MFHELRNFNDDRSTDENRQEIMPAFYWLKVIASKSEKEKFWHYHDGYKIIDIS